MNRCSLKGVNHNFLYAAYMGISSASLCVYSSQLNHYSLSRLPILLVASGTCMTYLLYWSWLKYEQNTEKYFWSLVCIFLSDNAIRLICIAVTLVYLISLNTLIYFVFGGVLVLCYFLLPYFPDKIIGSKLKGILKTILLAMIWALATTVIPFAESQKLSISLLFFLHRFFFMMPLCILFDLKDKEVDRAVCRPTMATICSDKMLLFCKLFCLVVFLVISIMMYSMSMGSLLSFILPFVLLATCLSITWMFKPAGKWHYYILVDGLMIYLPLLCYIGSFCLPL